MRKINFIVLVLALITLITIPACKNKNNRLSPEEILQSIKNQLKGADTIPIDKSITFLTAFNSVFLDSNDVKNFMLENPEFEPYITDMIGFYKTRNFQYAWFDSTGMIEQASNFINVLNNDQAIQNDSSLINKKLFTMVEKMQGIRIDSSQQSRKNVLEAEIRLTGQFFKFAHSTYEGKNIDAEKLGWFIPRKKVDLNMLFDSTIRSKNLNSEKLFMNPIYQSIQEKLTQYQALKKEPWDSLQIKGSKLQNTDSLNVLLVKRRLMLLGDYSGTVDNVFDSSLTQGIKTYQHRFGLKESGIADKDFIKSINTPVDTLLKKILINLERAKWMPAKMPSTFVWVNIPEFKLNAYEDDNKVFDMNVVVGSQANNTIIFTEMMEYVVFAPYWGVPRSIVKNEIVPAMNRNPNYLANNNMEITGYSGGLPEIRQKPGEKNSLGLVKFLFPNTYDIYFHDTPSKWAFSRSNRDLSHGCIRLQEPAKFAQWVLRYNPEKYNPAYIDSMMHDNPKETYIKINKDKRFPVYLVYFTAWVGDDGRLMIRDDIYRHDQQMEAKLLM